MSSTIDYDVKNIDIVRSIFRGGKKHVTHNNVKMIR